MINTDLPESIIVTSVTIVTKFTKTFVVTMVYMASCSDFYTFTSRQCVFFCTYFKSILLTIREIQIFICDRVNQ